MGWIARLIDRRNDKTCCNLALSSIRIVLHLVKKCRERAVTVNLHVRAMKRHYVCIEYPCHSYDTEIKSIYINFNIKSRKSIHAKLRLHLLRPFLALEHRSACLTNKSRNTRTFKRKLTRERKEKEGKKKEGKGRVEVYTRKIIGRECGISLRRYLWTSGAQFPVHSLNSLQSIKRDFIDIEIIRSWFYASIIIFIKLIRWIKLKNFLEVLSARKT